MNWKLEWIQPVILCMFDSYANSEVIHVCLCLYMIDAGIFIFIWICKHVKMCLYVSNIHCLRVYGCLCACLRCEISAAELNYKRKKGLSNCIFSMPINNATIITHSSEFVYALVSYYIFAVGKYWIHAADFHVVKVLILLHNFPSCASDYIVADGFRCANHVLNNYASINYELYARSILLLHTSIVLD